MFTAIVLKTAFPKTVIEVIMLLNNVAIKIDVKSPDFKQILTTMLAPTAPDKMLAIEIVNLDFI